MKAFEKVIFLLPTILFAVLLIAAAARAQGGSVVVLDQTNFTRVVNDATPAAFVSFYKQPNLVLPAFSEASENFKNLGADPPIVFAQVDAAQNPTLASKFNATNANITTLIWFSKGSPDRLPYSGVSLSADDIFFWVINRWDFITTTLTSQNFDQVINGNQYALVEFYAPWCSFCKALQLQYLVAAAQLKFTWNNQAVMAKVDADSTPGGRTLAARFNVTGFPTLFWFVNGKAQPYTQNPGNPQDSSDLVFWVVTQTDSITRTLTDQNFDQVINGNQYALVYFYAPWCSFCKALAPQFAAASSQLKALGNQAVMAKVDADSTPGGRALAARFNVTGFPALFWFVNGKAQPFTGPQQDPASLVKWVESNSAPPGAVPSSSAGNCQSTRLGSLCLAIPAYAFYVLLAAAFAHLAQALAWVVVSKRNRLFSLAHFAVVLFVPVFGLFCWIPLCRARATDAKSVKMLDALI